MVGSCVSIGMCNQCAVNDKSKPNFSRTHLFHLIDWLDGICDIAAMELPLVHKWCEPFATKWSVKLNDSYPDCGVENSDKHLV